MKGFDLYVALGDSISIDYYAGPGLGAASLLYKNRDDLYPEFKGRDLLSLNPRCEFLNKARNAERVEGVTEVVESLTRDERRVLITLTVGGNDLIKAAGGTTDFDDWLEQFEPRLDQLLASLRALYPNLTLLYGNVYDPGDGTGEVQSGYHEVWARAFAFLPRLNDFILAKAEQHGAAGVDIYRHFLGHALRHDDPDYEHYCAENPSCWIFYNIEPTRLGSSEVRRLFWSAL